MTAATYSSASALAWVPDAEAARVVEGFASMHRSYRHIDTATLYNNERGWVTAFARRVCPRRDLRHHQSLG
jgi:diketogulonate reductase-like aldo/keto reductase